MREGIPGRTNAARAQIAMGFICPECRVKFDSSQQLEAHYAGAHATPPASAPGPGRRDSENGGRPPPSNQTSARAAVAQSDDDDIHEQFLRAVEPQLAELKEVALAMGSALDMQKAQLERLDHKTDTVNDGLKHVTVQAKRMTGTKLGVNFRFRCAFQEVVSGKFLRDADGEAVLGYENSVVRWW